MSAIASQIVYSTVYSGADQRKHQSSAPLSFVRGIHRWAGQLRGKCFHSMTSSWIWNPQVVLRYDRQMPWHPNECHVSPWLLFCVKVVFKTTSGMKRRTYVLALITIVVNINSTVNINERRSTFNSSRPSVAHDDVIKWKHFPRFWPFVRGIHRYPVNSPHKGQWRGALMFPFICVGINGWIYNREAGDLRRYCAHYDVSVMIYTSVNLAVIGSDNDGLWPVPMWLIANWVTRNTFKKNLIPNTWVFIHKNIFCKYRLQIDGHFVLITKWW